LNIRGKGKDCRNYLSDGGGRLAILKKGSPLGETTLTPFSEKRKEKGGRGRKGKIRKKTVSNDRGSATPEKRIEK